MKARVDLLKRTTAVAPYQPPREPSQLVIWPGGETGFDPSIWDRNMRERLSDYWRRELATDDFRKLS